MTDFHRHPPSYVQQGAYGQQDEPLFRICSSSLRGPQLVYSYSNISYALQGQHILSSRWPAEMEEYALALSKS